MSLTVAQIKAKLEKKFIGTCSGTTIPEVNFLPTGHIAFDYFLGGGLPESKLIEIFGNTHTGKSTLALNMAKAVQDAGKLIYIIDSERSIQDDYLKRAGVDPELTIINRVSSLDEALEFYQTVLSSPDEFNCGAFIFDTVKGLQTQTFREKISNAADASEMAASARVWSTHRSILTDLADFSKATVIFVNHQMKSLSPYASAVPDRPGGGTIPQICSVSLQLKGHGRKLADDLKSFTEFTGTSVDVHVIKSRFKTLGLQTTIDLTNSGYDKITTLIRLAKIYNLISNKGAWYNISLPVGEDHRAQGFSGVYAYLNGQPEVCEFLRVQILKTVAGLPEQYEEEPEDGSFVFTPAGSSTILS